MPAPNGDFIPEPTSEQCSSRAVLTGRYGGREVGLHALWYPQMGGYIGRAIALCLNPCWEVWVWHDGEFPFTADSPYTFEGDPRPPAHLHHCMPEQFIDFGQRLLELTPPQEET